MTTPESPLCSRQPNPARDMVPIRFDLTLNQTAGLDGLARIDGKHRKDLIEDAVNEYINRRLAELTMVLRMSGRNPVVSHSDAEG